MLTPDIARQLEAEDLTRAKDLTRNILENWNFSTWNELLADDVVLFLHLELVGVDRIGDLNVAGGNVRVVGREDAKRVLKCIYSDIKRDLRVTTEFLSGYDVVLLGNMALGGFGKSWPIVIYMGFNDDRKICVMTIAVVDLQSLTHAFLSAAKVGTLKAA